MGLGRLKDLTGEKWRQAKKDAGVKGAGFFTMPSGKAVGDKIDRYQEKRAAWKASKDANTFKELFDALCDLEKAFVKVQTDRSFKSDLAKEMQSDLSNLIQDVKEKQAKLAKIHENKEAMAALNGHAADQLNQTIDTFVL